MPGGVTPVYNVLYIIGAGFSAPLGLPVIRNFLFMARDMLELDPIRYKYFRQVLDQIRALSTAKNYLSADLFNIEHVLSILEMRAHTRGEALPKIFVRFLADVIEHYTPDVPALYRDTHTRLKNAKEFCSSSLLNPPLWSAYISFIACAFCLEFMNDGIGKRKTVQAIYPDSHYKYGFLSLNYDLILERALSYIQKWHGLESCPPFFRSSGRSNAFRENVDVVSLAKLHGTVAKKRLVAPTWNKTHDKSMLKVWALAEEQLKRATFIRFLGYSLPESDSYFQYLLSAALTDNEALRGIDVVCQDPDGSVRSRYERIISFRPLNFVNANLEEYLMLIHDVFTGTQNPARDNRRIDNEMERGHREFLHRHGVTDTVPFK